MKTLDQMKIGSISKVISFVEPTIASRLMSMGIVPGISVSIMRKSLMGSTYFLQFPQLTLALEKGRGCTNCDRIIIMSVNKYQIALVGNPNVGKSSVFNLLTGLQQKVGNFPGVTVDKKSGSFLIENNISVKVIDLPGLYSLFPTSEDERVVVDVLLENLRKPSIDLILYIIDANDLERNLLLFSQIKDLNYKMIVGVNMMDTAQSNGLEINLEGLSESFGVPFIPVNGRSGEGIRRSQKKYFSSNIRMGN
jgi:small GTP-binding protein